MERQTRDWTYWVFVSVIWVSIAVILVFGFLSTIHTHQQLHLEQLPATTVWLISGGIGAMWGFAAGLLVLCGGMTIFIVALVTEPLVIKVAPLVRTYLAEINSHEALS
jgi:hypothetical protein